MSQIRVAFVTPGSFAIPSERSSSVEFVVMRTVEQMKSRAEIAIFGIKTRKRPARELHDGIQFVRLPRRSYIYHVCRSLRRFQPDVIQVENRPRFARYIKRLFPDTLVVLSLHSTAYMSPPHISRKTLHTCLDKADSIVVNSAFLKSQVEAAVPEAGHKTVVNHPGVDTGRFKPRWELPADGERHPLIRKLGLENKKVILYAGRLLPIKGVHHLIRSMPAIVTLEPDAVLLVVGGAYYGSKRKTAYVRKLHRLAAVVKEQIRFVPFVAQGEMPDLFRLADVVVVPSPKKEAFGLVNVEAMASGVPVVAAAAGGMPEIIEHGRAGLLVDPSRLEEGIVSSVCAVLGDPLHAKQLGENAVNHVREHFSWQRTAEGLLEQYRSRGKATPD